MGIGTFLGGLATAYQGAQQGVQDNLNRTNAASDRQFLEGQRAYQQGQQQRLLDQQARDDQLRTDLSAITPTGTPVAPTPAADGGADANTDPSSIDAQNGNDVGGGMPTTPAAPKLKTQDQELRDVAAAYRKVGSPEYTAKALDLETAANKIQFGRATQQFNQVIAGADKLDVGAVAKQIGDIFDSDPANGGVKSIERLPDGVRITLANKDTGVTSTREFTGPNAKQQLISAFQSYYSPETWAQLQAEAYKSRLKTQEDLAKNPVERVPGGYFDKSTGRFVRTREFGAEGGGAAGKPYDANAAVETALSFIAKNSNFKENATPEQAARAQTLARQFVVENSGRIDPAIAAEAAVDATLHPEKVQTKFDPATNQIVDSYEYQGGNLVVERRGTPGAGDIRGLKPEQVAPIANKFIADLRPEERSQYVLAATSRDGRDALSAQISAMLRSPDGVKALQQKIGHAPSQAEIAQAIDAANANIQPRLNLISLYADPNLRAQIVADAKKQAAPAARVQPAAGMNPPAKFAERLKQQQEAETRAAADAAAKKRADADARQARLAEVSWLTPELARTMKPSEAADYYRKYGDILPTAVVRELRKAQ